MQDVIVLIVSEAGVAASVAGEVKAVTLDEVLDRRSQDKVPIGVQDQSYRNGKGHVYHTGP